MIGRESKQIGIWSGSYCDGEDHNSERVIPLTPGRISAGVGSYEYRIERTWYIQFAWVFEPAVRTI